MLALTLIKNSNNRILDSFLIGFSLFKFLQNLKKASDGSNRLLWFLGFELLSELWYGLFFYQVKVLIGLVSKPAAMIA